MNNHKKNNGVLTKKLGKPKVLGPVSDLELFVQKDWWRLIFNSLYLKTDADVIDDNEITKKEIDIFVKLLNVSQADRILDLCCGQGRHTIEMSNRGFQNLDGLDRSHYLITRAKTTAKKAGLNIKFREGDARKLPYDNDVFDVVMLLGNSFGYFETIHDDLLVLKGISKTLKPFGKLLLDVSDGGFLTNNYQKRSWEWINNKYFVCRERSLSRDKQKLISREVITHTDKGVIADQFYSERLYNQDSIIQLLKEAGFSDIEFHGSFKTESERNQDLGMMEQRILVTASVKKEWTPVTKSGKDIIHITVLLGDPNKHDVMRPNGVFDKNDFVSLNELKKALFETKNFQVKYLNNHNTILQDLASLKNETDLVVNFCDEGYNNDPRKELHIASMLEILDIPYSGGGPQCLAFCYDKSLVRGIATEMNIPTPNAFFIKAEDNIFELSLNFPLIVKPNLGDASFGITSESVCYTAEELLTAISNIRDKFGYDHPLLVEEFLVGKDLSLGVIGNPPNSYTILPIIEADYSSLPEDLPKICGYEAKWQSDSPYWNIKSIPADLPEDIEKQIGEYSLKLFERLECRDYARFDWRLDANGNPRLLEVNPNSGWAWADDLANMAKLNGMSYTEMLNEIIKSALERYNVVR